LASAPEIEMQKAAALAEVRASLRSGKAKALREAAGLSQRDVAEAVGATAPTISLWERGLRRPLSDSAIKYGRLLRILASAVEAAKS
jgi:transcriptional regulator with XRE-family HTH domain